MTASTGSVVKNHSDLSPAMRYALTSRARVSKSTAYALERRGMAIVGGRVGHTITLTESGQAARDAVLAPLVPGARIRHTQHGKLGRVVRVDRGEHYDSVVLRWDGWTADTAGTPTYLEVIADDAPAEPSQGVPAVHTDPSAVVQPVPDNTYLEVIAEPEQDEPMSDLEAEQDQDYRAAYDTVCNHCGDKALDGVGTCERHTDYRHPAVQHHRRVQGQAAVVRNSSHVITWLAHRASWRPERAALGVCRVEVTEEGGALHMTSTEALLALAHELDRPVQVTWCDLDGGGFLGLSVRWTEGPTPMRAWEHADHPERARAAVERLLISTGATAQPMADGVTHEVHWHPLAEALGVPVTWIEG